MNALRYLIVFFIFGAYLSQTLPLCAEGGHIRYPAVAGAFYPYDAERLSKMIDGYLQDAGQVDVKGDIVGIVAPHAGYQYSGPVAAYAYKALAGRKYDTVVIIGVNHRMEGFRDISIYKEGLFKMPFGNVPVDAEYAQGIMSEQPKKFVYEPDAHAEEHSVEVQIPFLQKVLAGDFKIVPIVMGDYSTPVIQKLAEAIIKHADGKKVLVVASSDLSHDKGYDTACTMDRQAIEAAAALDIAGVVANESSGKTEMCGYGPVLTLMCIAKEKGLPGGKILKYANSGDTTGDKYGRIVGYGAVVFSKE
ncbi:MAG TPA: AmmeMemoRadiSam system protein B [bacterium]|nr:AmmeMemoRadiSam system protein B [bacterium]